MFYWLFAIIVGSIKLRTMIISNGKTGTHSDHFALYLIRYALTVMVFVLENMPKPKNQYIMLSDEDEVNRETRYWKIMCLANHVCYRWIVRKRKQIFLVD